MPILREIGDESRIAALERENAAWSEALNRLNQFLAGQLENPESAVHKSAEEALIRGIATDLGLVPR